MYSNRGLHIFDSTTSATSLIIQNNNQIVTTNITQGTNTTPVTVSGFIATFLDNNPSVHEAVSGSTTERIMIFRTAGVNHTFTIPSGGLTCDILMIGGGGGSDGNGGGGAGACIVSINQLLPEGTCVVRVGDGGAERLVGVDSFIQVSNIDRYRAKGGGGGTGGDTQGGSGGCGSGAGYNNDTTTEAGGAAVGTNVVTINDGTTNTLGPYISDTHRFAVMGNAGGNNGSVSGRTGSGGGIGAAGTATTTGGTGGTGGNGAYQVSINGTIYNFRNHFANGGNSFGVQDGSTGNYYIGGGGGGYDSIIGYKAGGLGGGGGNGVGTVSGTGGGAHGGRGGSGIVIIRYRVGISTTTYTHQPTTTTTLSTPTLGTPSIELVRGTQGDSNTDYKIGNYNGDFIVKSSVSGVDTDYIRIVGTSASIFNSTASPQWSTVSDRRIKENIEKASYDKCYDTINKLELYRFNYIKELNSINKDKTQLGYIAQEVNDVFPKAVSSYEFNNTMLSIPDLLSIDIAQINYSLYGAVKKLIEINNNKEVRLKKLESILNIECDSSNVAIVENTITSNVAIIEDTITSNIVIEAITSNIVIEGAITSNIVIEEAMTSNIVIEAMTSNIVIEGAITSNIVIEEAMTSNIVIEEAMTSNIVIENTITSNIVI